MHVDVNGNQRSLNLREPYCSPVLFYIQSVSAQNSLMYTAVRAL